MPRDATRNRQFSPIKHSSSVHPLEQNLSKIVRLRRWRANRLGPLNCPSTLRYPPSHCLGRSSYTTISPGDEALFCRRGRETPMVPLASINRRRSIDDRQHHGRDCKRLLWFASQVSKEEYETCRITNPSPRVIAVCDKPRRTMYFTITFRPFTPQPGGLEFLPGHDYYFISTSSKDDLHRRIGGRCTSHNMKVVFKVCCGNEAETSSSSATSRNNCKCSEKKRRVEEYRDGLESSSRLRVMRSAGLLCSSSRMPKENWQSQFA